MFVGKEKDFSRAAYVCILSLFYINLCVAGKDSQTMKEERKHYVKYNSFRLSK